MIKKISLFTILILFIFIFGCGLEKPNDILFYALKSDPKILNPVISSNVSPDNIPLLSHRKQ